MTEIPNKSSSRQYSFLHFISLSPKGGVLVYMNLYLKRVGLNGSQLGTVAAIFSFMSIFSSPTWGIIADSVKDMRRIIVLLFLSASLVYPLLLFTKNYYAIFGIIMLFSFLETPVAPLNDALTLSFISQHGGDYGRIRLWGSIGIGISMLLPKLIIKDEFEGNITSEFGYGLLSIFIFFSAFRLLGAVWLLMIPNPAKVRDREAFKWNQLNHFVNVNFVLTLITALMARAAMQAYYIFFSIHLDGLGVPDSSKGFFWALGVASEVGMMFVVGNLIKQIGIKWTVVIGMLGMALRLFFYSQEPSIITISFLQLFHALTYTAFHVGIVNFISTALPDEIRASGQALYNGIVWGLGGMVGGKICGGIAETHGMSVMFKISSIIALLAALITSIFGKDPQSSFKKANK